MLSNIAGHQGINQKIIKLQNTADRGRKSQFVVTCRGSDANVAWLNYHLY